MTGTTISSRITKTVTLGSGGYTSPLTISSAGTIDPTAGGATGLYVPSGLTGVIIVNDGVIDGGAGATSGAGGIAVSLKSAATLTNGDAIIGGHGGISGTMGLAGGIGIYALAADSITNTGVIEGGSGGNGSSYGGDGGIGALIDHTGTTLTNTNSGGFITGIFGGAGGNGTYGGDGGIGVELKSGAAVNNSLIEGGSGGYDLSGNHRSFGVGGYGVSIDQGTLTNGSKGSIQGCAGGEAKQNALAGGFGGVGVYVNVGTVSNLGSITGGVGGASLETGFPGNGGHGGIGLRAKDLVTVSNTGTIIGGLGGYGDEQGGTGGIGAAAFDGAVLSNAGIIIGGAGGAAGSNGQYGGSGYFGVVGSYASVSNTGSVRGGEGGAIGQGFDAGTGGGGVSVDHSTLSNSGTITGGTGALGVYAYDTVLNNSGRIAGGYNSGQIAGGYDGGEGLTLGGGNAVNTGTIIGGAGAARLYDGGGGGDGVYLSKGATLSNSNWLAGGEGGYGEYYNGNRGYGGDGGTGVVISNAVLINAGTISGGAGGEGGVYGAPGDAVAFKDAGTLVVEQGAVFIGDVAAETSFSDVLELAGTSSAALTGIGTQFTNFTDISFASGAAWTIAGNTIGLASGATISGFAAGDTIVLDGFAKDVDSVAYTNGVVIDIAGGPTTGAAITLGSSLSGDLLISSDGTNTTLSVENTLAGITLTSGEDALVLQHGKANHVSVMAGGFLVAQYGGKIISTTVETSGAASVISGGVTSDTVVDNKAALYVNFGGTAVSTTIKNGGLEQVFGGGITTDTVIDGGTLALVNSGGVTGTLKFSGKGGVLQVDQTEIPTTVISGFKAGDKVELLDAASAIGTVTVTKANVVTISADGKTYKLNIAGAKVGETNFRFSGFALTETGSKMAIQRPAESPAAGHALPELFTAGGHQAIAATPAPSIAWSASAAPYAAPSHELIHVPHGGIQTMVTLQSG